MLGSLGARELGGRRSTGRFQKVPRKPPGDLRGGSTPRATKEAPKRSPRRSPGGPEAQET